LLIPHDFISPWNIPTFFHHEIRHTTPRLIKKLSLYPRKITKSLKINIKMGGVYLQSIGPRLETPAEIRMFSGFADIVGMTLGSEATLANELGIDFVAICSVDNYCNGIKGEVTALKIE
jgi:5'-methylthioadenosine phosphorylase